MRKGLQYATKQARMMISRVGRLFRVLDGPIENKLDAIGMQVETTPEKRRHRRHRGGRKHNRIKKDALSMVSPSTKQEIPPGRKDECGRPAGKALCVARFVDDDQYDEFDLVAWPDRNRPPKPEYYDDRSHSRRGSDILKERRRSFYPSRLVK